GLLTGSFLNVVIYRLPLMMDRQWRSDCAELLKRPEFRASPHESELTLSRPRSHCTHCGHMIAAWENIPLFSFIFLRGKCGACRKPISPRYPVIEFISGLLAVIAAGHYGFTWPLAGALILTWGLLCLSVIDYDHQLLPDSITMPLLWLGLSANLFGLYTGIQSAVIGAMAGYLLLWSIYWLFKLATGKEGMGFGDFKLLAMLGAWLGWKALPVIILLASLTGAIVGVSLILLRGRDKNLPIPFGPYLACAGWAALLWGDVINRYYWP
ncbi:MAG: prepilin peptidase, partial [Gammaproteobacteria bacterium]|nr:prepilin peptidase [Gammaproteobacteria bacterium]